MSLNIALSGIQAVNGQLNQISNNIANSGTFGFKSGRANFASSYMQGAPQGVYIGSTSQSMDIGGNLLSTGRGLDAAIQGRGFFVSRGDDGAMSYSRVGMFNVNKDGLLVDAFGRHVQGYGEDGDGNIDDIVVPSGGSGAEQSSELTFAANMSADWEQPATTPFSADDPSSYNGMQVSRVYDSLGREHTVTQYFVKGEGNSMQVHYAMDGTEVGTPTDMSFGPDGNMTAPTENVTLDLGTPDGALPMALDIDYADCTMYAGEMSTTTNHADG